VAHRDGVETAACSSRLKQTRGRGGERWGSRPLEEEGGRGSGDRAAPILTWRSRGVEEGGG
jgi:hypothetical protein